MNEERGPSIDGLDGLVVFLLYYNIFFTIILIAYVMLRTQLRLCQLSSGCVN